MLSHLDNFSRQGAAAAAASLWNIVMQLILIRIQYFLSYKEKVTAALLDRSVYHVKLQTKLLDNV